MRRNISKRLIEEKSRTAWKEYTQYTTKVLRYVNTYRNNLIRVGHHGNEHVK